MLNKKLAIFIIALILLSFLAIVLVQAQETPNLPINPENIEKTAQQAETKWDYLSRHWKIILLNITAVKSIDSAMKAVDETTGFFIIFMGFHWDLTLMTLFSIIIWLFFLFTIKRQLYYYSDKFLHIQLNEVYRYLISIMIVVIFARANFFYKATTTIFSLFTTTSGKIILAVIFLVILWALLFLDKFGKAAKKAEQAGKATEAEEREKRRESYDKGFEKGSKMIK